MFREIWLGLQARCPHKKRTLEVYNFTGTPVSYRRTSCTDCGKKLQVISEQVVFGVPIPLQVETTQEG